MPPDSIKDSYVGDCGFESGSDDWLQTDDASSSSTAAGTTGSCCPWSRRFEL
jgi:hypothetical protein